MSEFYHKEKVIGSGTFGNVWLVKSKISNNLFVLKEVDLSSMNATEKEQALAEVSILSRCKHRNIIKYKNAEIDDKKGLLSIIMEYADAGDLYSAIMRQRGVPFKEHDVITWFTQICLALQYIHHKNILHRDLKSKNIFLSRDKQIKVGDFGIARCLRESNELATTAIGTPYYLSPEICQRKPYSYKSDIWALGCILFEMAALSHPFQAWNFSHLLSLILTGKRKQIPRHCSSLIRDLVELLLNDNPECRPSSDEILALPFLQQYLSEVWITQNSDRSSSVAKLFNQKKAMCFIWDVRHHSLCRDVKNANQMSSTRRASVSSVESRAAKNGFGVPSNEKNSRINTSSRSFSFRGQRNTSCKSADNFSTYKVLNPVCLKQTKVSMNGSKFSQKTYSTKCIDSKCSLRNDETDHGYQSEEFLKYISREISEFDNPGSVLKTSTKKHVDVPKFGTEQFVFDDEVFYKNGQESIDNPDDLPSTKCSHSQCQQCMLDMLWMNRIRRNLIKSEERIALIRKLKAVFGHLYDPVYSVLISNWETNQSDRPPKYLQNLTNSLNYNQFHYLPLMLQLIQLDLLKK